MIKSIYLCILFFSLPSLMLAQTEEAKPNFLGLSYFSEGGLYPGFTLNYERRLLGNNSIEVVAGGKVGSYFHYRNHTGIFFMIQSGQRFRLVKNLYFEDFLGVGYLHTFLNGGDAYYVDATGTVRKATNKGNAHFMPSISAGLAYHINKKKEAWIFARPMTFWQIPFNQGSLLQFAAEVGLNVKVK